MIVWSYGGGVQSAAIAVLIADGRLPRPDFAVIADTGREPGSTWSFLRESVQPLLNQVGVVVEVAPHDLATVDLYSGNGDLLIPAFTRDGKMPTFCSTEWKQRVVRRWVRQRTKDAVTVWLGISVDEVHRAKNSGDALYRNHYPLLYDVPLRRSECIAICRAAGIGTPPRSSCWMCPHRSDVEWSALTTEEFGKAIELDNEIRQRDTAGGVFLHRSRTPLAEVDLKPAQGGLFDACDSGYCWT